MVALAVLREQLDSMTSEGISNLNNSTILQSVSPRVAGQRVFLKILWLLHFGKHSSGRIQQEHKGQLCMTDVSTHTQS